ncbi:MAG: glycerophosphodiester phosphodiesterase [Anaerolineae bacterium]|nr:MAG: glycerophosphodiester phosphodiesterase [Anaerolineae bacterium]
MNLFASLPRPAVVAHRGASAHAPENTLAAFRLAASQGAHAVELDARLSADLQVVVFHDDTLNRTTNGQGPVGGQPLAALRQLDAGGWCDSAYAGETIPTLGEVFESLSPDILINIELKERPALHQTLVEAVATDIRRHDRAGSVLVSSFDRAALRAFQRLMPEVATGRLALPGLAGWRARHGLPGRPAHAALHPYHGDVRPALLSHAHAAGCRVLTYTVNHPDEMRRLFDLGVDGIFTDDPALARRMLPGAAP